MKRARTLAGVGIALVLACSGACSDGEDRGFEEENDQFGIDAATDAGQCGYRCSLDGRSVIDVCTGIVVATCSPEQACGAGTCMDACAAAAADKSTNGCEFYFQSPRIKKTWPQNCYAAFLVNTSQTPATVALELEGSALDLSKAMFRTTPGSAQLVPHTGPIEPGASVILFVSDRSPAAAPEAFEGFRAPCPQGVVPATFVEKVPSAIGIGASFHLTTNVPVATTTIYPFGGANSWQPTAAAILPVATWGKEHVLIDGWERADEGVPAAQIVASEDDTVVTLVPNHDLQDGVGVVGGLAGSTLEYHLSKGQFLQLSQTAELTGSTLVSNKPTTVFGGHTVAWIPADVGTGDFLQQQIPAYEQWGSEYVGVGYRPRLGDEHEPLFYRIVAAHDGTRLDYDPAIPPGAPTTLGAGEVATFRSGTGDAFVVRTQDVDHPIYVAAYMTGGTGYDGQGDPEFVNVVPADQYLSSYSFFADTTYAETSLVIVRARTDGAFEDVWLECAGNLAGWKPIGTRGQFEFVRVDLQRKRGPGETFGTSTCQVGLQRMHSDGAFTATVWGWDEYASYAYPGGMAQRKLVDAPLTIVH